MEGDREQHISFDEFARLEPESARALWAEHVRSRRERDGRIAPGEQVAIRAQGTRCNYCQAEPADWAYPLDDESFRVADAPGYSPAFPMLVCDRCAGLFNAGRDDQLLDLYAAALTSEDDHWPVSHLIGQVAQSLRACHAAAGSPVRLRRD